MHAHRWRRTRSDFGGTDHCGGANPCCAQGALREDPGGEQQQQTGQQALPVPRPRISQPGCLRNALDEETSCVNDARQPVALAHRADFQRSKQYVVLNGISIAGSIHGLGAQGEVGAEFRGSEAAGTSRLDHPQANAIQAGGLRSTAAYAQLFARNACPDARINQKSSDSAYPWSALSSPTEYWGGVYDFSCDNRRLDQPFCDLFAANRPVSLPDEPRPSSASTQSGRAHTADLGSPTRRGSPPVGEFMLAQDLPPAVLGLNGLPPAGATST